MDLTSADNFRRQVLLLHYELSQGETLNPVDRPVVAERLGFGNDYNNDKLIGAISYWSDKHYLEGFSNMADRITVYGIDEVEKWLKQRAQAEAELNDLLNNIAQAMDWAQKGILEGSRLKEVRDTTKKRLGEIVPVLGEENQLRYKKLANGWTLEIRSGFTNEAGAKGELAPWQKLIEEMLNNSFSPALKNNIYIPTGDAFAGRATLRLILRQAKTEIWLQDNFLHPEILVVLEPYIAENPNLKIHLLMREKNNSNLKSFESDFKLFNQKYATRAEAKHNDQCHGRFIILDGAEVYSSGHSLNDLGNKADMINKITEQTEAQKIIVDFSDWWTNGTLVT